MVLDDSRMAGLANFAARAIEVQIRQATTTANASSSAALSSPTASPTPTDGGNGGDGGGGGGGGGNNNSGSSPLLFFVALGFGVVFTNLWIIVGVKYCFRYNARNRNIRMTGEDGEPINLENMPQHPRRRRREKKLMTIDEVNEKFPMMKYKSWVASRAQEGLPTRGGISQPPSRANSVRDVEGVIPASKERDSIEDRPVTSGASVSRQATHDDPSKEHAEKAEDANDANDARRPTTDTAADATLPRTDSPTSDDEIDEDDQIHDALPPEMMETSGDTCAICIDTLEDDDDVRGLTCGHAFHAVCLDPWLTSRRACCPLCKADYYTPKPRPQPADGTLGVVEMGPTVSINQDPRSNRMNMPPRPGLAWIFSGRRGRMAFPGMNRNRTDDVDQQQTESRSRGNPRRQRGPGFMSRAAQSRSSPPANNTAEVQDASQSRGFMSNFRLPFGGLSSQARSNSANNTEVTPSNLEAGTRSDGTR